MYIYYGNSDITEALLETFTFDFSQKDNGGRTVFDYAKNYDFVAEILLQSYLKYPKTSGILIPVKNALDGKYIIKLVVFISLNHSFRWTNAGSVHKHCK